MLQHEKLASESALSFFKFQTSSVVKVCFEGFLLQGVKRYPLWKLIPKIPVPVTQNVPNVDALAAY
jgi:hypothetical protein